MGQMFILTSANVLNSYGPLFKIRGGNCWNSFNYSSLKTKISLQCFMTSCSCLCLSFRLFKPLGVTPVFKSILYQFSPAEGAILPYYYIFSSSSPSLLILQFSNCIFPECQDVDMMDQNGMTPLMWAAYRTHRFVRSQVGKNGILCKSPLKLVYKIQQVCAY